MAAVDVVQTSEEVEEPTAIREQPYAFVIRASFISQYCSYCGSSKQPLSICEQCNFVHYCSEKCKIADFADHRLECFGIQQYFPQLPTVRLIGRTLARRRREIVANGRYTFPVSADEARSLDDLMTHEEEIQQDRCRMAEFQEIVRQLKRFVPDECLDDENIIFDIFSKIEVNSFGNDHFKRFHVGFSVCDHSCSPDAIVSFEDVRTSILRPLKADVDLSDLRKVTISYIDALDTTENRRRQLSDRYYFICCCPSCLDRKRDQDMQAFLCDNTNCKGKVVEVDDSSAHNCRLCERRYSAAKIRKTKDALEFDSIALERLERVEHAPARANNPPRQSEAERLVQRLRTRLHSSNVLLLRAQRLALAELSRRPDVEEAESRCSKSALKLARQLWKAYRQYYPAYHPRRGQLALWLVNVLLAHCKVKEATAVVTEGMEIFLRSQGPKNESYIALKDVLDSCRRMESLREMRRAVQAI